MSTPSCCGREAVWTVISPRLQYWYCKECRKEVGIEKKAPTIDDVKVNRLTQEEIDALFAAIDATIDLRTYWRMTDEIV